MQAKGLDWTVVGPQLGLTPGAASKRWSRLKIALEKEAKGDGATDDAEAAQADDEAKSVSATPEIAVKKEDGAKENGAKENGAKEDGVKKDGAKKDGAKKCGAKTAPVRRQRRRWDVGPIATPPPTPN